MTEQQNDHHQFPAELLERQGEDLNITEGKTPVLGFKMQGVYPFSRHRLFIVGFKLFFFPQIPSLQVQSSKGFCLFIVTEPPTKGVHFWCEKCKYMYILMHFKEKRVHIMLVVLKINLSCLIHVLNLQVIKAQKPCFKEFAF